jgi:hypothetical protein
MLNRLKFLRCNCRLSVKNRTVDSSCLSLHTHPSAILTATYNRAVARIEETTYLYSYVEAEASATSNCSASQFTHLAINTYIGAGMPDVPQTERERARASRAHPYRQSELLPCVFHPHHLLSNKSFTRRHSNGFPASISPLLGGHT